MKQVLIIIISISLLSINSKAQQLLSWQQKMELVGVPENLSRTMLKDLFFANGFSKVYNEYTTATVMNLENSLSKENGKWYAIGNKHLWHHYTTFGRGNITVDIENSKLIFKNPIPDDKLKAGLAKDIKSQAKLTATKEANARAPYTAAEQAAVDQLRHSQQLIMLDGITGDFDQPKLKTLFEKNDLPQTSYGGLGGVWLLMRSLQQIDQKWYVTMSEREITLFNKYKDDIAVKNGKMTFANKL